VLEARAQYTPAGMAAILTLAYEQAFFSGRSLWQMIVGGVFGRFPELKVVFTETQAYWISVALDQFDRRVRRGDDWTEFAAYLQRTRAFSRLPSEYWAANCYAGISPFHPSQLPLGKLGSGYDAALGDHQVPGAADLVQVRRLGITEGARSPHSTHYRSESNKDLGSTT
jgi:hypothetical protein